jgi:altronate dehydratase large subunit
VICASVVAERVAAAVAPVGAALPHLAGCGQLGPDMQLTHETLAAYCAHPNVGAVVVIALGCEQVVAQMLTETAKRHGKPAEIVAIQSEGGTVRATERGSRIAQTFADRLAPVEREWCDIGDLILSLKCGGSDYTSGLASNPALGRVTDRLVDLGGTAVLGEIAETLRAGGMTSEIIAASIRHPEHIVTAAKLGCEIATVPAKVLRQMLDHPLTEAGAEKFRKDWESRPEFGDWLRALTEKRLQAAGS